MVCEESWTGASVLLPSYTNCYHTWQVFLSVVFQDLGKLFGTVCAKSRKSPERWTTVRSDTWREKAPGYHWVMASTVTATGRHCGSSFAVSAQVFGRSCCEWTRFKSEVRPGQSFCSGLKAVSAIWGASDYNRMHGEQLSCHFLLWQKSYKWDAAFRRWG